jgi:hypothetical protein
LAETLTFEFHADAQTFLESTMRTSFPLRLVDETGFIVDASIDFLILNGSLEETFRVTHTNELRKLASIVCLTKNKARQSKIRSRSIRNVGIENVYARGEYTTQTFTQHRHGTVKMARNCLRSARHSALQAIRATAAKYT